MASERHTKHALPCVCCPYWKKMVGWAYWNATCVVSGRMIHNKSYCDQGFSRNERAFMEGDNGK